MSSENDVSNKMRFSIKSCIAENVSSVKTIISTFNLAKLMNYYEEWRFSLGNCLRVGAFTGSRCFYFKKIEN